MLYGAGELNRHGLRCGEGWLACRADGKIYAGDYFEGHNEQLAVESLRFFKAFLSQDKVATFESRFSTMTIPGFTTIDADSDYTDRHGSARHLVPGFPLKVCQRMTATTATNTLNYSKNMLQLQAVEPVIGHLKNKWTLIGSWGSLRSVDFNVTKVWLSALLIHNLEQ